MNLVSGSAETDPIGMGKESGFIRFNQEARAVGTCLALGQVYNPEL